MALNAFPLHVSLVLLAALLPSKCGSSINYVHSLFTFTDEASSMVFFLDLAYISTGKDTLTYATNLSLYSDDSLLTMNVGFDGL